MRLELWSGGFFGDVGFEEAVQAAWCQFKLWKRRNKVSCSQPSFKASHVDRFDYRHFFPTNMISEVLTLYIYLSWNWIVCLWDCELHPQGDYQRGSTLEPQSVQRQGCMCISESLRSVALQRTSFARVCTFGSMYALPSDTFRHFFSWYHKLANTSFCPDVANITW